VYSYHFFFSLCRKTKTGAGSVHRDITCAQILHQQRLAGFVFLDRMGRRYKQSYHFERVFVKLKGLARKIFHGYATFITRCYKDVLVSHIKNESFPSGYIICTNYFSVIIPEFFPVYA
jgi:hypothetical protein